MLHPALPDAVAAGLSGFRVEAPLSLSQWAERHFYLSTESSYREGEWRAYPYQVGMMDAISNDEVVEIAIQKSARVGYTKILVAAIAYFAEHKRRNQCIWQPTDEDRDDFVKDEIEPMCRDVAVMERVFPKRRSRHKDNTLRQKRFIGSTLHMRGGNAAKNYRRISVDCGYLDEADAFPRDVGKSKADREGSPRMLGRKRTEGATFPKFVIGSTPKVRGASLVEEARLAAEVQLEYLIRCIHCNVEHPLSWGGPERPHGFKWEPGQPATVRHVCPHCGGSIRQSDYLEHWVGRWVDQRTGIWLDVGGGFRFADGSSAPAPRSLSFFVWTAYSPQASWMSIVTEAEEAEAAAKRGNVELLKAFTNTTRGETWKEIAERLDIDRLLERGGTYPMGTVPAGAVVLVTGVDVQDDRWEFATWGFGRGEQMWLVDYAVRYGDPGDLRDWQIVEHYRQSRFPRAAGGSAAIAAMAVDTGGHFTHEAYQFARKWRSQRVFAIRGSPIDGKPIRTGPSKVDINMRGHTVRHGVELHHVGTDTAKDLLHNRLRIKQPGPGFVNFPSDTPREFYEHLAAEERVTKKTAHGTAVRWEKVGPRNEGLDCTVYAIWCSYALNINTHNDASWRAAERAQEIGAYPEPRTIATAPKPLAEVPGAPAVTPTAPRTTPRVRSPFASDEWSSRL